MSVEDDTDLRDLVAQTLESNGCLAKIRAQLRSSIFLALDEDEKLSNKEPLMNNRLKAHLQTNEGKAMFCIVREFLEFFGLEFSISVFEPESYLGTFYKYEGRGKIMDYLGFSTVEDNAPVLLHLLKSNMPFRFHKNVDVTLNHNNATQNQEIDKTEEAYSSTKFSNASESVENSISECIEKSSDCNSLDDSVKRNLNATFNISQPVLDLHILNGNSENNFPNTPRSDESKISENGLSESDTDLEKIPLKSEEIQKSQLDQTGTEFSPPILKDIKYANDKLKLSPQKTDKLKPKSTLSSLADLPPLQLNKSRANDSLILPSLYNRDFKERANLKEIDKFLEADSMDNYEEDLPTLNESDSVSSDHSKLLSLSEHVKIDNDDVNSDEEKKQLQVNDNKQYK